MTNRRYSEAVWLSMPCDRVLKHLNRLDPVPTRRHSEIRPPVFISDAENFGQNPVEYDYDDFEMSDREHLKGRSRPAGLRAKAGSLTYLMVESSFEEEFDTGSAPNLVPSRRSPRKDCVVSRFHEKTKSISTSNVYESKRAPGRLLPPEKYRRKLPESPKVFAREKSSSICGPYSDLGSIREQHVLESNAISYSDLRDQKRSIRREDCEPPRKLVERLETMRRTAIGNGETQCMLCGAEFGLLGPRSYAAMCHDCRKYVCQKSCGVETTDNENHLIFLCKICGEYREMWKKSGAWFYQGLPKYVLPEPGSRSAKIASSRSSQILATSRDSRDWIRAAPRRRGSVDDDDENDADATATPEPDIYPYRYRPRRFGLAEENRPKEISTDGPKENGEVVRQLSSSALRRKLPSTPPLAMRELPRFAAPKPRWALEHTRCDSFHSEKGDETTSDDEQSPSVSGRKRESYRRAPIKPARPDNAASQVRRVHTSRISDSDSDAECDSQSPTPRSSTAGSLQTPTSSQDPEITDRRHTPVGESDNKSMESVVLCNDKRQLSGPLPTDCTPTLATINQSDSFKRRTKSQTSLSVFATASPGQSNLSVERGGVRKSSIAVQRLMQPIATSFAIAAPTAAGIPSRLPNNFHKQLSLNIENSVRNPKFGSKMNIDSSPDTSPERELDSLGTLEFSLLYSEENQTLSVNLKRAKNLRAMDSNGFSDPYIKLHMLPGASKSTKLRTKTIHKTLNPEWDETLLYYGVTEDDRQRRTLRITVYDQDRIGSDFLGETRVPLKKLTNEKERFFNVYLEKQQPVEQADPERGKLLLGLCYDKKKECLVVGVIRCAELLGMDASGYSDPYVKLSLKPDSSKKRPMKTRVKKRNCNPEYNEEFSFPAPLNELAKRWLEITVWDRDVARADDYIGGLLIGTNAKGEPARQWQTCIQNPGKKVERWHKLKPDLIGHAATIRHNSRQMSLLPLK